MIVQTFQVLIDGISESGDPECTLTDLTDKTKPIEFCLIDRKAIKVKAEIGDVFIWNIYKEENGEQRSEFIYIEPHVLTEEEIAECKTKAKELAKKLRWENEEIRKSSE